MITTKTALPSATDLIDHTLAFVNEQGLLPLAKTLYVNPARRREYGAVVMAYVNVYAEKISWGGGEQTQSYGAMVAAMYASGEHLLQPEGTNFHALARSSLNMMNGFEEGSRYDNRKGLANLW